MRNPCAAMAESSERHPKHVRNAIGCELPLPALVSHQQSEPRLMRESSKCSVTDNPHCRAEPLCTVPNNWDSMTVGRDRKRPPFRCADLAFRREKRDDRQTNEDSQLCESDATLGNCVARRLASRRVAAWRTHGQGN